jgi:hypothetical protein
MIHEALSVAQRYAVATPPPFDIVWPRKGLEDIREALKSDVARQLSVRAQEVTEFIRFGEQVREQLVVAFSNSEVESIHVAKISEVILVVENQAYIDSKSITRRLKKLAGVCKKIEDLEPTLKGLTKDVVNSLRATEKKEIDERLDFAIFLRALKARYRDKSNSSKVFDNVNEMIKSLDVQLEL